MKIKLVGNDELYNKHIPVHTILRFDVRIKLANLFFGQLLLTQDHTALVMVHFNLLG